MEKAILRTLAYADIFDYPLKKNELWLWLIKVKREKGKGESEEEFEKALKNLLRAGRCQQDLGYHFLPGREKIIPLRKKREKASKPKTKKAKKVVRILKFIPFIKLIGITGGLARKNSEKGDDIDLFFITSRKRLWLTRGLIVLILSLLGVYRRPGKVKDMICPNMLAPEEALKMEPEDLFTAHEVAMMKPIFDRDRTYQKFLLANPWAGKFLPNANKWQKAAVNGSKKKEKILNSSFLILDSAERLAKRAQLAYMRKRRTTEVVSDSLIKFHPEDARGWVLEEYQKRLQKLQID